MQRQKAREALLKRVQDSTMQLSGFIKTRFLDPKKVIDAERRELNQIKQRVGSRQESMDRNKSNWVAIHRIAKNKVAKAAEFQVFGRRLVDRLERRLGKAETSVQSLAEEQEEDEGFDSGCLWPLTEITFGELERYEKEDQQ